MGDKTLFSAVKHTGQFTELDVHIEDERSKTPWQEYKLDNESNNGKEFLFPV